MHDADTDSKTDAKISKKFAKIGLFITKEVALTRIFTLHREFFNHTCLSGKAPPGHELAQRRRFLR